MTFDADNNGGGQQAAQSLASRLREQGVDVRRVSLRGRSAASFRAAAAPGSGRCWRVPGRVGDRAALAAYW